MPTGPWPNGRLHCAVCRTHTVTLSWTVCRSDDCVAPATEESVAQRVAVTREGPQRLALLGLRRRGVTPSEADDKKWLLIEAENMRCWKNKKSRRRLQYAQDQFAHVAYGVAGSYPSGFLCIVDPNAYNEKYEANECPADLKRGETIEQLAPRAQEILFLCVEAELKPSHEGRVVECSWVSFEMLQ